MSTEITFCRHSGRREADAPNLLFFRYILLDPSCSGSGIVNRLDFLMEDRESIKPHLSGQIAVS